MFSDASEKAYGAAAYLQGQTAEGEPMTRLVMSKSRVAPIKKLTLPRLELMGALIAARMGNNLLQALNMQPYQIRMWTDSMIVMQWISSSPHRWKQFVANRVTEIQSLTPSETWSHCSGKHNPNPSHYEGPDSDKTKGRRTLVVWASVSEVSRAARDS